MNAMRGFPLGLLLLVVAFVHGQQNMACPNPSAGPYTVLCDGFIYAGYRCLIQDAISRHGDIALNNGVQVAGTVWSGGGVQVNNDVDLNSRTIFAIDFDDVEFQQNPNAVVCVTGAPPMCDAVAQRKCDQRAVEYSEDAKNNLRVIKQKTVHRYKHAHKKGWWAGNTDKDYASILTQAKTKFLHGWVGPGAVLEIQQGGVYHFRTFTMMSDTVLKITTNDAVEIRVVDYLDLGDRVQVEYATETSPAVTFYQQSDSGYIHIGNQATSRPQNTIRANIVSLGKWQNGGYVNIGLRQRLQGYISAAGDCMLNNEVQFRGSSN